MNPALACLECGGPIPSDAKGLCPRCLLKLGLASRLSHGFIETGVEPAPFLGFDPNDPSKRSATEPFEFGGYRILRLLGRGGMGAVYEADDLASGRRVALKVLGHSLDSPEARKRFLREGRLAGSINHPNTVYVFGTEEIEGAPVITMELVPGGTLHDRVKAEGPMPVAKAVDVILQIVDGLEAAYAAGILHRDIKPSNCFVDPDGAVKVGDFGLSVSTLARGDSALTLMGSVLGTPEFSSPEQLRGEELSVRSDIYSVGVTLYYLLTGRTPFQAENLVQLLATVLDRPAPSPRISRPEIPEALAGIILRCLAKQSGDRFRDYAELRAALLPFNSTAPAPATLARRFGAFVIDNLLFGMMNFCLSLIFLHGFSNVTGMYSSPAWRWISVAGVLLNVGYFAILEGVWGASVGKRMLCLLVTGPDRSSPGVVRAALRAALYLVPHSVITILLMPGAVVQSVAWSVASAAVYYAYPVLLCLSARRRNGFATVVDLLTQTRVIEKSAVGQREALVPDEERFPEGETVSRIGLYHILGVLGKKGTGEERSTGTAGAIESPGLFLGYDAKLLRRVWIRRSPAGELPVSIASRNTGRPGRLRWLQGLRTETESWDAYEAVSGAPLLHLLHTAQPWKKVRYWLHDLAAEFDGASQDGSLPTALSLDRVWITADGRAKLLDFPAPGVEWAGESIVEPSVFLNQIAVSALQGSVISPDEARTRAARVPLPIPARGVLQTLRDAQNLSFLVGQLQTLTHQTAEISLRRRLGLIAGCVLPGVVLAGMMLIIALLKFDTSPNLVALREALDARSAMAKGEFPSGVDPRTGLESAEIYIAGRYGELIRDPKIWAGPFAKDIVSETAQAEARRIVAAHPNPDPAEMGRARAALAPALDFGGDLDGGDYKASAMTGPKLALFTGGGVLIWAAFFSVVCAPIFRGGLLMRVLGIAVVRADGTDASRLRMLWRACVAWSWMPLGIIGGFLFTPFEIGNVTTAMIVVLMIVVAVLWSAMRPDRSLQDKIAGTWLVPR